jgi:hypothetical protein
MASGARFSSRARAAASERLVRERGVELDAPAQRVERALLGRVQHELPALQRKRAVVAAERVAERGASHGREHELQHQATLRTGTISRAALPVRQAACTQNSTSAR